MIEDNFYKFLKYYNKSPQWVKSISGRLYKKIPLSARYGRSYSEYTNLLKESQWWSDEKIREYQWRKLSELLEHAYQNVPYYRRVFDERGIKPKNIQNFNDFQKVPFLTKDMVRDDLQNLVAENYAKSKRIYITTGGSTGIPLGLYYEKGKNRSKELAFMTAQWRRVGYRIGDKLAVLRGNVVSETDRGKFWEFEPIMNRLILSSYHMTDGKLPLYIKQIRRFSPKYLHVYPSALTILARFMEKKDSKPFESLQAILAGSENMYPWQIELFTRVFKCKILFWYGLAEQSALAGTCEKSYYYHIFPEYSYVELIGEDCCPVTQEEKVGEIVGTTFDSYVMPLIRYRTQDLALYTKQKCKCGRNYSLLKRIEGRIQELVVTKNGALVTLTALIFAQHFNAFGKVKNMQLEQSEKGKVIVRIVRDQNYGSADEDEIRVKILQAIGGDLDIVFEYVSEIQRTKRGKYPFLIQKLPVNFENLNVSEPR